MRDPVAGEQYPVVSDDEQAMNQSLALSKRKLPW